MEPREFEGLLVIFSSKFSRGISVYSLVCGIGDFGAKWVEFLASALSCEALARMTFVYFLAARHHKQKRQTQK